MLAAIGGDVHPGVKASSLHIPSVHVVVRRQDVPTSLYSYAALNFKMSSSGYRQLLPATRPHSPPAFRSSSKRKRVAVACNSCRTKRIGCDGGKPSCTACRRSRRECVYLLEDDAKTLRDKLAAFQEIMELLKDQPHHVVQGVLQRLGRGSNPMTVLGVLKGEFLGTPASEHDTARAVVPTILSDREFEMPVHHPDAYCTADLAAYTTAIPGIMHTDLSLFEFDKNGVTGPMEDSVQYYDARLALLDIGFWTHVPITNAQAAGAISLYLDSQLPSWGLFDTTLFVRDLVEQKFEFCSPFMVISLLSLALVSHGLSPYYIQG